jgi:hypothetical protein
MTIWFRLRNFNIARYVNAAHDDYLVSVTGRENDSKLWIKSDDAMMAGMGGGGGMFLDYGYTLNLDTRFLLFSTDS